LYFIASLFIRQLTCFPDYCLKSSVEGRDWKISLARRTAQAALVFSLKSKNGGFSRVESWRSGLD